MLSSTKINIDFQGLNILASYASFPPYCIIDSSNEKIKGVFIESLQIAAQYLNLTLILQQPKPQNKATWFKK